MLLVAKNPQKCKPSDFIGHTAYMSYKPSAYFGHTAYRLLRDSTVNHYRCRHVADVFAECVL